MGIGRHMRRMREVLKSLSQKKKKRRRNNLVNLRRSIEYLPQDYHCMFVCFVGYLPNSRFSAKQGPFVKLPTKLGYL